LKLESDKYCETKLFFKIDKYYAGRAKKARKIRGLKNICPSPTLYGLSGQPDYLKVLI